MDKLDYFFSRFSVKAQAFVGGHLRNIAKSLIADWTALLSHKKERDRMRLALRIAVIIVSKTAICATALFAQAMPKVLAPAQKLIVSSVETMSRAAASNDPRLFDSVTTPGFYIFDAGTRFDGKSILTVLQQLKASGKRFE